MSIYSSFRPSVAKYPWADLDDDKEFDQLRGPTRKGLRRSDMESKGERASSGGAAKERIAELDASLEQERVRDVSLLLLPLLLANPPSVPGYLKSSELKHRHEVLSLSPHEPDDYLVTPPPISQVDAAERVMSGLEHLRASVEQLAGILATDTDAMERTLGKTQWNIPDENTLLAQIPLGDPQSSYKSAGLVLILIREDDGRRSRELWKYHNLLPADAVLGTWHEDFLRAVKASTSSRPARVERGLKEGKRVYTKSLASSNNDSFNTAAEQTHEGADQEGEGARPDLFMSADDFWGGWDDEEGAEEADEDGDRSKSKYNKGKNSSDDDDNYWNSYDTVGPQEEQRRREAEEAERQDRVDNEGVSGIESVNFDRLERQVITEPSDYSSVDASLRGVTDTHPKAFLPMQGVLQEPPDESTNSMEEVYETMPAAPGGTLDSLYAQREDGAILPRLDATNFGNTDEDEWATLKSKKAIEGAEAEEAPNLSLKIVTPDDEPNHPKSTQVLPQTRVASADDCADAVGEEPLSPSRMWAGDDKNPSASNLRKSTSAMLGIADVAVEQQHKLQKCFPPRPMSVSGQSTYETPVNMNLAELEALYRDQNYQRMREMRERISQMKKSQRRNSRGHTDGGEENEKLDSETEAAMKEAKSALGVVVPHCSGLPGVEFVGPKPSQRNSKWESRPSARPSPQSSRSHSHRSDPIDALLQADMDVGDDLEEKEEAALRAALLFKHRAVPMDMLRKMTEQRGPGPRSSVRFGPSKNGLKSDAIEGEATTSSGQSKAGGFRNFLQIAPSTIFTDLDGLEEEEMALVQFETGDETERRSSSCSASPAKHGAIDQSDVESEVGSAPSSEPMSREAFGFEDDDENLEHRTEGFEPEDWQVRDAQTSTPDRKVEQQEQKLEKAIAPLEEQEQGPKDYTFDFDAFMYPQSHEENKSKGKTKGEVLNDMARQDSSSLSDNDPSVHEAISAIANSQKGRGKERKGSRHFAKPNGEPTHSESFLPGAASDASVRPLLGSVVHRLRSTESAETGIAQSASGAVRSSGRGVAVLKKPEALEEDDEYNELDRELAKFQTRRNAKRLQSTTDHSNRHRRDATQSKLGRHFAGRAKAMDAVNSTVTELGVAEIDEAGSEKYSVAPGPQWAGATPPPGSTSQRTANLRHQYLKEQRKQVLEVQRSHIQAQRAQQRGQTGRSAARALVDAASKGVSNSPGDDDDDDDITGSLRRAASREAPFPREQNVHPPSAMSSPAEQPQTPGPSEEGSANGDADKHDEAADKQSPVESGLAPDHPNYHLEPLGEGEAESDHEDEDYLPEEQSNRRSRETIDKSFSLRQQKDRHHASQAAARRREIVRAANRRTGHLWTLLRSVVHLFNDDAEDILSGGSRRASISEAGFLLLCREAWRDSEREREERIANGAGGRASATTDNHPTKKSIVKRRSGHRDACFNDASGIADRAEQLDALSEEDLDALSEEDLDAGGEDGWPI